MQKKKKKVFLVFLKLGMLDFYKSKIHKTNKKEKQKRKCKTKRGKKRKRLE